MTTVILVFTLTFIIAVMFGYLFIKLMTKIRVSQTILHYVDNHNSKIGTPTMGGIMFLLPTAIITMIFSGFKTQMGIICVGVMISYAIVGFLDDFIKIRHKENLGLKAYQKIIAQTGIAIIMTFYCYYNDYIGTSITLPFTDTVFELGWWYLPLCFIVFIASTNAVNLTDGLDGLAGWTSFVAFLILGVLCFIEFKIQEDLGATLYAQELNSLLIFIFSLTGGILGFLWHNSHPAKVFMGDTGSLALGGSLASVALFLKNPLIILIVGIMFVVSCISVIMQVIYFKATHGKRIFVMAPLHHHLQYKGIKESKIVAFYTIITILAGGICLLKF